MRNPRLLIRFDEANYDIPGPAAPVHHTASTFAKFLWTTRAESGICLPSLEPNKKDSRASLSQGNSFPNGNDGANGLRRLTLSADSTSSSGEDYAPGDRSDDVECHLGLRQTGVRPGIGELVHAPLYAHASKNGV